MMPKRGLTLIAFGAALGGAPVIALGAQDWQAIDRAHLQVTSGTVFPAGSHSTLRTRSAVMRAVVRDGGHHAAQAKLWFRLQGKSETTTPLGSGLIRRQIGLKLRAKDPCNLVYVMWQAYPEHATAILVKSNPGQSTSTQCGNRGYTDVATIPLPKSSDGRSHVLEAHTRRATNGTLALTVYTDGALLRRLSLSADLTAGLDGPIGVRSDNGDYRFRLYGRDR